MTDASVRQPVTIEDVARAAGVSGTTVSRVLNRQSAPIRISALTQKRVWEVATRLGYRPNVLARGLRGQTTYVLGCLFADMADPLLQAVGRAVQAAARERGYRLLIADAADLAQGSPDTTVAFGIFDRALVDGVLILGSLLRAPDEWARYVEGHRSIVAYGMQKESSRLTTVSPDNRRGSELLLEHLYELGHRRIAYIGCQRNLGMRVRYDTFRSFVESRGLDCPGPYVQDTGSVDFAGGFEELQNLLAVEPRPTAVYAANDRLALGAICAAHQAGVAVPGELSIGGFDDLSFSAYSTPRLTTVHQPIPEIGRVAITLLLDMIEGRVDPASAKNVVVQPELVVRQSTAPVRPAVR